VDRVKHRPRWAAAALTLTFALTACVPVAIVGQDRPVVDTTTALDLRSARCSSLSSECPEPAAAARSWTFDLRQPAAIQIQLAGSPRQLLWLEITGPRGTVLFRGKADAAPRVITAPAAGVHRLLLSTMTLDQAFEVKVVLRVR